MYHKCGEIKQESFCFRFSELELPHKTASWVTGPCYFAATELTSMVSPSRVPVTMAVLPACLSKVASAAWSLVFRVYILSPTTSANLEPCATHARVHSAAVEPSMCFLPHMASPTSPVKVRGLAPARA